MSKTVSNNMLRVQTTQNVRSGVDQVKLNTKVGGTGVLAVVASTGDNIK